MKTVELKDGSKVKVSVFFGLGLTDRRITTAVVYPEQDGERVLAMARTWCSLKDRFVRKEGRRIVMKRLNERLKELGWSREDRKRVVRYVYPGVKDKPKKPRP